MNTVKLPNQNNKLQNNVFAHISFAPAQKIMQSNLPVPVIIQEQGNDENKFDAQLVTMVRSRLMDLSSIETYLAAGMERTKFIHWFMDNNKNATYKTEVAVYIYIKLKSNEQHINEGVAQ